MGKKGVLLDNGKKAQSSMTLYWKNNKQRQKMPKQKRQKPQDEEKANDKHISSNFQKWKLHKEKLITKAYTKPQQKDKAQQKADAQRQKKQQEEQQQRQFIEMMEKKKPKVINVPGFSSKQALSQRLEMEKPKVADQTTNILELPAHMQDLTQDDIMQILREKKAKKEFQQRQKALAAGKANSQSVTQKEFKNDDVLLGEEFIDLMRKKQRDEMEAERLAEEKRAEEEQKRIQRQKQETFFKSDILNKINVGGLDYLQRVRLQKQQKELQEAEKRKQEAQAQKEQEMKRKTQVRSLMAEGRMVPRVLKK